MIGRVLAHRFIGLARVRIGPQHAADRGETAQPRDEAPKVEALAGEHHVVGVPGRPSGVANVTEWPSRLSTLQLTATSVGSKSRLGIGISTFAMFDLRRAGAAIRGGLARALVLRHMNVR